MGPAAGSLSCQFPFFNIEHSTFVIIVTILALDLGDSVMIDTRVL